jgi:hypothetical protein
MDQREVDRNVDAERLRAAYDDVLAALGRCGTLLRTSSIHGYFGWVAPQKTAVSGLAVLVRHLQDGVPKY